MLVAGLVATLAEVQVVVGVNALATRPLRLQAVRLLHWFAPSFRVQLPPLERASWLPPASSTSAFAVVPSYSTAAEPSSLAAAS